MRLFENDAEIGNFSNFSFAGFLKHEKLKLLIVLDLDRSNQTSTVVKKFSHRHRQLGDCSAVDDCIKFLLPRLVSVQNRIGVDDVLNLLPLHDPGQRRLAVDPLFAYVEDAVVGRDGDDSTTDADGLSNQRIDVTTLATDDQDVHASVEFDQ